MIARFLAYRAARRVLDEPSAARSLAGGVVLGFLGVLAGLILLARPDRPTDLGRVS